jgi:hypothetical protein
MFHNDDVLKVIRELKGASYSEIMEIFPEEPGLC